MIKIYRKYIKNKHPDLHNVLVNLNERINNASIKTKNTIDMLLVLPVLWGGDDKPDCRIDSNSPRKIIMLAFSDLRFDSRIKREAIVLAENGYEIEIVVPDISNPSLINAPLHWNKNIKFNVLNKKVSTYVYNFPYIFHKQIYDWVVNNHKDVIAIHCHDLTTSFIGVVAAKKIKVNCVCDFHEWWSEIAVYDDVTETYKERTFLSKKYYKAIENLIIKHADTVITVCDSIAKELADNSNSDVSRIIIIIKNIPDLNVAGVENKEFNLREKFNIDDNLQIVLYQGGVGPSRHLEVVIEALKYCPQMVLIIRGPSIELFMDDYQKVASIHGVSDRLYCIDPVASDDVVIAARLSGAIAGIYTVKPLCKSWKYALPNKLYEYLFSGLPVMSADYPETRKFINEHGTGILFDADNPRSIADSFTRLQNDASLINEIKENMKVALCKIKPEAELEKLVSIYKEINTTK